MRNLIKALISLTIIIIFLPSCATVGRKIDQSAVDRIKKGETTKEQVVASLGSPDRVTVLGNGDTIFSYGYARATAKPATFIPIVGAFAGGADVQHQNCTVTFGPDNLVKNFTSIQGGTEVGRGLNSASRATIPEIEEGKRPK